MTLLAAGSAGGILVPTILKGWGTSSPPQMLPYVTKTAQYGLFIDPMTGAYTIPAGCPVGYHAIIETPVGGINTVVPAQPAPPTLQMMQAFDYYAVTYPPSGFVASGGATPQFAVLELVVVVVVLAIGGYFVYKIYKWASQLPPPDTNVYR